MRKIPAVLTVLAVAGVSLVACSAAEPIAGCERPASNDAVADLIDVSGGADEVPKVSIDEEYSTDKTVFADVEQGDGAELADMDQVAAIDMAFFSAETGDFIISTPYDGTRQPQTMDNWLGQFPGLEDALTCASAGSRTVVGLPSDGVSDEMRQQYAAQGFPEDGSLIAVVDVHDVYPRQAWGTAQYNGATNMPSVVRAPDGRPGITVPDKEAPSDLVVETLLKGDGEKVESGDKAVLRYTGVVWDTGEVFDSSWENGSALVLGDDMIEGFTKAIEGQTVGSQVMAVIPPDLGYGDQANGPIPAGATLVFVADIVGIQK
ncbi:MAG: FKBP-type peptidyl-prolyl cis-trans isomerase [Microbacterium sp.]